MIKEGNGNMCNYQLSQIHGFINLGFCIHFLCVTSATNNCITTQLQPIYLVPTQMQQTKDGFSIGGSTALIINN